MKIIFEIEILEKENCWINEAHKDYKDDSRNFIEYFIKDKLLKVEEQLRKAIHNHYKWDFKIKKINKNKWRT